MMNGFSLFCFSVALLVTGSSSAAAPAKSPALLALQASSDWRDTTISLDSDDPLGVSCADVDGDGAMDVVEGHGTIPDQTVVWHENVDGAGSSWAEHPIVVPPQTLTGIGTADIDGDGDADVLSVFSDRVTWDENLTGDGSAWLTHSIDNDFLFLGTCVGAGDLDGDGDQDVLVGKLSLISTSIIWYENVAGDGTTWAANPIPTAVLETKIVRSADVDRDGDLDLLGGSELDSELSWYENANGIGTSWTTHLISNALGPVGGITTGDLDCDGDVDLTLTASSNGLSWIENQNGGGTWTVNTITSTISNPTDAAFLDGDEDGDLDVIAISAVDGEAVHYENVGGDATSWTETVVVSDVPNAFALVVADFDRDGSLDFLSSAGKKVVWHENPFDAPTVSGWSERILSATATGARVVASGDIDGEGDPDVLWAGGGTIAWFENSPANWADWSETVITTNAVTALTLAPAEVDGDGDLDVLSDVELGTWHENLSGDGSAWADLVIASGPENSNAVCAGDFDNDGDADAASSITNFLSGGRVSWFENLAGDGSVWAENVVSTTIDPDSIFAGDFDGDGDLDALASSFLQARVVWFANPSDGVSPWTEFALPSTIVSTRDATAADVDGDGDLDTLAVGNSTAWYENLAGDGTSWSENVLSPSTPFGDIIHPFDVDGDGDIDALSQVGIQMFWYENLTGDGSSWQTNVIDANNGVSSICAVDLDGNGSADVLTSDSVAFDDEVSWWAFLQGALPYGCGVNPDRSLRIVSPQAQNNPLVFGIDNPLGTQASGSFAFLLFSFASNPNFPCGSLISNFGMKGAGTPGELLVSLAPGDAIFPIRIAPLWTGFGCPSELSVTIPNIASLEDTKLYAQGLILDPTAAFGVKFGLTNALEFQVGP